MVIFYEQYIINIFIILLL